MESNLKNQTQLFTFTVLNLLKVMETCKEVDAQLHSQLQESSKYLNMALNVYLSATSSYRLLPPSLFIKQEDNAMEIAEMKLTRFSSLKKGKPRRQITRCFADGTKVKHSLNGDDWIGIFDAHKNVIIFQEKEFSTLYGFVKEHYFSCQRSYTQVNAWKVCKYEHNGEWLNTANL
jgi:hypothetical protein